MAEWEKTLFNKLLIAIPELNFSKDYVKIALDNGWISKTEAEAWLTAIAAADRGQKFVSRVSADGVFKAIMSIAPELMSVRTVDFLRKTRINGHPMLTVTQANALRVALNGAKVLKPVFVPDATLLQRAEAVYGAATSTHLVNLIRDLDNAKIANIRNAILRDRDGQRLNAEEAAPIKEMIIESIRRAQIGRSLISTAEIAAAAAAAAQQQSTVWGAITVVLDHVIGHINGAKLLKNAIRAGVISENKYALIRSLQGLGVDVWHKVGQARQYESWAARSLIISEGILSHNMITVLREAGFISPKLARRLYPVATIIRGITRGALTQYQGGPKFFARQGETPIQTFARIGKDTDRAILGLLSEAAEDTRKTIAANAASDKFGKTTGAAQQRVVLAGIHEKMREVWEDVGSLTIFGEKEAAAAAMVSAEAMAMDIYNDPNTFRQIKMQARNGVNAYISRQENVIGLSRRVYSNTALSNGWVDREINKGLIRGLSAREMAANVARLILPSTPGGVSYAAMRLARTEINNAFHLTSLRYTREMPWVTGYKWNLSGSHPKGQPGDPCGDMASRNHDNLGRGVYKKSNVPNKPHPQCLCYVTMVTHNNRDYWRNLRRGRYAQYLESIRRSPFDNEYRAANTVRDASNDWLKEAGLSIAKAAGVGLFFGAVGLGTRMAYTEGLRGVRSPHASALRRC